MKKLQKAIKKKETIEVCDYCWEPLKYTMTNPFKRKLGYSINPKLFEPSGICHKCLNDEIKALEERTPRVLVEELKSRIKKLDGLKEYEKAYRECGKTKRS